MSDSGLRIADRGSPVSVDGDSALGRWDISLLRFLGLVASISYFALSAPLRQSAICAAFRDQLSPPLALWPFVAFNEYLAIRRHTRFGETFGAFQLQFDADDLFHPLVAKIGVLRRKG